MDLSSITEWRRPASRGALHDPDPAVGLLAGGTWMFGEPQPHLTALVDLTALGWPAASVTADGDLELAATCTIRELVALGDGDVDPGWVDGARPSASVARLFRQCAESFLASFKIWRASTVGGNVCAALPAGPMISLLTALDATALVWRVDGSDAVVPIDALVTGNHVNALAPGDVLRSVTVPAASLTASVAFRRIALSTLGRTGTLVIGRLASDGSFELVVTGGTVRPARLASRALPDADALAGRVEALDSWFTDAHGTAEWRRAQSARFAREIVAELGATADEGQR